MYRAGQKLLDIAKALDVPDGTVRRWKSSQDWDGEKQKKKQTERSETKPNVRKQRGAPLGNENAKGNRGGAPTGSQNNLKHGVYAQVFWDVLDDEEHELIGDMPNDEERHLLDELALLTVRERRLMKKIAELSGDSHGLILSSINRYEDRREFDNEADRNLYNELQREKVESGNKLPGRTVKLSTTTINGGELLLRAHSELSRVQSQKLRCISALIELRKAKAENDAENDIQDDGFIAAMRGMVEDEWLE